MCNKTEDLLDAMISLTTCKEIKMMRCPVCESKIIPMVSDVYEPNVEGGILWLHECCNCEYKWLTES